MVPEFLRKQISSSKLLLTTISSGFQMCLRLIMLYKKMGVLRSMQSPAEVRGSMDVSILIIQFRLWD